MYMYKDTEIMKGCYIMGLRGSLGNNSRDDDIEKLVEELYSTVLFYI